MIPVTCTNEQKVPVSINPVTLAGNPAPIDGDVTYEVTGDATVEVIEGSNGKEVFLVSGAADTVSIIAAKADADLGEGVTTIEETFVLTVTQAGASRLGVTVGEAIQK